MNLVEQQIHRERLRLAWQRFALIASSVLLLLALAQGAIYFFARYRSEEIFAVEQGRDLMLAGTVLALLGAAWKAYLLWKNSEQTAGRLIDQRLSSSKNRLEASAELIHTDDPIAEAQRKEAAAYLAGRPDMRHSHALALLIACNVALLLLNGTLATKVSNLLHEALAQAEANKPHPPKIAARDPYARIDITAPDSEIRATPIEEVVVKADADSDNGFKAISLQASINGGPNKSIPIDAAQVAKGGAIKFNQSLLLDELNAQPYDLVGYYFEGESRHATPLKVASQIQFIEVRPFREDVRKGLSGAGGASLDGNQSIKNLQWLISQEIIVSKRTWILATNQLPSTDPAVVTETAKTGDQQDHLATRTHEVYQHMTEKGVSASIVDHVQQAEQAMRQAVEKIKKPALLEANPIQQKALGELVAATKDFIKVMDQAESQSQESKPKDPFKDKQKLPADKNQPQDNAMAKLEDLMKRENDVVKEMASSTADANPPGKSESSKTGQEQAQISKDLSAMQNDANTPPTAAPAMSEAQQAAQNSADKLAGEDAPGALNDARAAEAAMTRAQLAMKDAADQQLRDSLAQAQQQLQDAAARERAAATPGDQQQVKENAEGARDNLTQERDRQNVGGDPKLAKLADELGKQFDQSAIPQKLAQLDHQTALSPQDQTALADALAKMADHLSADRLAMQSETQNLEDVLKRIDRIQHNMDGTRGTPEQQAELARELQGDLKTALADAKVLLPPGGQPKPAPGESSLHDNQPGAYSGPLGDNSEVKVPLGPTRPIDFQPLKVPLAAFRQEVEQRLEYLRAQSDLSYLDPDQSPEEYRAQVAAYYERISREAKAAPNHP